VAAFIVPVYDRQTVSSSQGLKLSTATGQAVGRATADMI